MKKALFLVCFALANLALPLARAQPPFPQKGNWALSFMTRPEVNDATLAYSIHDRFAFGFHGIRNHWPQKLELHYAFAQLDSSLLQCKGEQSQFRLTTQTGLGLANKLKGVDRLAHLVGITSELETKRSYSSLRATTIGARDFDRKNFVGARAGFFPYEAEEKELKTLVMLHALYENHAEHKIEYGPVLNLRYKNVATEFYGTFKGVFSWGFSFVY